MSSKKHTLLALGGAMMATVLVAGAVAVAAEKPATDAKAILEAADIKTAEDWAEQYPNEYMTYMQNLDAVDAVDYLEEYEWLPTLYAGNAFSKDYLQARGHAYTLDDIAATKRAPAKANCLSCKTPTMNALIASDDAGVYTLEFADVFALCEEPVSCYTCHANDPESLAVTNIFLTKALGDDADEVDMANQVCGQCHNEYYFAPDTKATTLPYTSLETMTPDAILAFYNEIGFNDYTDPATGIGMIKVQHPEFETYLGEGSIMANLGYTCADCHMGEAADAEGDEFANHFLASPLANEQLLADDCVKCHKDLAAEVEAIQVATEARTDAIALKLVEFGEKYSQKGEGLSFEDRNELAELVRAAMFYWDFVFVENSEGAHNSALTEYCLDKAEAAIDAALKKLA